MLFKEKSQTAYHPGGHTHREQKALFRVGNLLTGESERRLKGEALRKRHNKVAIKHGFEGARERILAWKG